MALHKSARYEIDMTHGPILKKLLLFTVPLILSSILQLLFNAADVVVVGRFAQQGDLCLAAVGSTGSLTSLIVNMFVGLSVGTNVVAARAWGSGDHKAMEESVHTSMLVSIVSGVILAVVGVIGARVFLEWMNTPGEVIDLSSLYLRIYFAGMPANMIYNFGSAILRSVGDTRRPLIYLIIAGVLNVILNLFFVIVLHMDVEGVALATIISQAVSAALVVICLMRSEGGLRLTLKKLRIAGDTLKEIARIGLPAGFQGVLFSISNVMIQSSINSFGATVMAGSSAAGNLEGFVYVGMNAFHQAAVSFSSQNLGAGEYKRIWRIAVVCQVCVTVVGLLMGVGVWFFGSELLRIYTTSQEVVNAGLVRLTYVCLPYALCGMMDVMTGSLRGIGYSMTPMLVSILGICVFRVAWIATVCKLPACSDIDFVYLSYPISWIITLIAHTICFVWAMRRVKVKLNAQ
ncbi:MAG: MATE family efflux transporter [Eubacteriales bacterium]|nr:MATE family efflux transporter [Eubacteriales bacterium]